MTNPFEVIDARLSNMETLLLDIKHTPKFQAIEARLNNIEALLLDLKNMQKEQGEQPETDEFLTIQEAAEFLKIKLPTMYSKVSKGELPVMKRGKRLYFSRAELLEYIKGGRKTDKQ